MESTLAGTFVEIQGEVGDFLGWGRGPLNQTAPSTWNAEQQAAVDAIIKSGLRAFYFPPTPYDWSFMRPTATMDFPVAAQRIQLPDDFGAPEGELTLLTTTSTAQPWVIQWQNEGKIRESYAYTPSMTGPPMMACVRPLKGTAGGQGQRWELFIFPAADQDYTLQLAYYVNPDYLSGAFPYAYGGPMHTETIIESCLAIAEQRRDDAMSVHTANFDKRLIASIEMDRKLKPQKIGYNRDRSDLPSLTRQDVHWWAPAATYNGQSFT